VGIRVNHPFSICLLYLLSCPFLLFSLLPVYLSPYFISLSVSLSACSPLSLSFCLFASVCLPSSHPHLGPFPMSLPFCLPPLFRARCLFLTLRLPFCFSYLCMSQPRCLSPGCLIYSLSLLLILCIHQFHPYNEFSPFIQSVLCLFHPLCL
jgi:hypothetical protein